MSPRIPASIAPVRSFVHQAGVGSGPVKTGLRKIFGIPIWMRPHLQVAHQRAVQLLRMAEGVGIPDELRPQARDLGVTTEIRDDVQSGKRASHEAIITVTLNELARRGQVCAGSVIHKPVAGHPIFGRDMFYNMDSFSGLIRGIKGVMQDPKVPTRVKQAFQATPIRILLAPSKSPEYVQQFLAARETLRPVGVCLQPAVTTSCDAGYASDNYNLSVDEANQRGCEILRQCGGEGHVWISGFAGVDQRTNNHAACLDAIRRFSDCTISMAVSCPKGQAGVDDFAAVLTSLPASVSSHQMAVHAHFGPGSIEENLARQYGILTVLCRTVQNPCYEANSRGNGGNYAVGAASIGPRKELPNPPASIGYAFSEAAGLPIRGGGGDSDAVLALVQTRIEQLRQDRLLTGQTPGVATAEPDVGFQTTPDILRAGYRLAARALGIVLGKKWG